MGGLCNRIAILKDGDIAFVGTADELTARRDRRCVIHVQTEQGEESFEAEDIGEALMERLNDYKRRNVAVLDVRVERATLEQGFMTIARGGDE